MRDGEQFEAARQAALLQALLAPQMPEALPAGWQALPGPHGQATGTAGLRAYRANASAHAARALGDTHPVIAQMVGDETFASLAWTLWRAQPPQRGDLAEWGEGLAAFIASRPELAEHAYLGDVARLEWAVHQALRAGHVTGDGAHEGEAVAGLALLGEHDPGALRLHFTPGLAVCRSAFPIVALWQAHQRQPLAESVTDEARFAAARAALAAGQGEAALVRRAGWRVVVQTLAPADADFTASLTAGFTLGDALAQHPPDDFSAWLVTALQQGWLQAVTASN